jgi:hypothetical protein
MALHFVLKGPTFWGGLFVFALGLLLGYRTPMPQGLLPIGLGAVAFVACFTGRLLLAIYLARTRPRTTSGPLADKTARA